MNNNELSLSQHEQALSLHQRIMTSGSLAAQNLWDMANALKEMRDGKLYKELGYQNFESYCEEMCGFSRINAYKYISIAENLKLENVNSSLQIGVTKLALLAKLSEEKQAEIAEAVDLESVSVRELKEEINRLKGEKMLVENAKAKLENEIADAADENARLERENKELRERPVEVAVVENSDNERRLKETIKALEAENYRQNEMMDRKNIEDRRKFEADKKAEIAAIREEYEEKLRAAQSGEDKEKQEFKVFLVMAHDALDRLISAASGKDAIYKAKIKELLTAAERRLED